MLLATVVVVAFAPPRQGAHHISAASLPRPHATRSVDNPPSLSPRNGAPLHVAAGYKVDAWATGLDRPRKVTVAPNGDVFVAESFTGRISLLRPTGGGHPTRHTFATGRKQPYGIAFYPPGPNPAWIYIGDTDAVHRWRYKNGNLRLEGQGEVMIRLPGGGYNQHWTRNVIFSPDAKKMYVTVGSASNASPEPLPRASIIESNPDGSDAKTFASGLRNPVGLAFQPGTQILWAAVNERDRLGDDLPPDYATTVQRGGFYGWPYYYIGDHRDPNVGGSAPTSKVIVPDVLLEAHCAALGITFMGSDGFVSMHGSWNRGNRSGYKVVRLPFQSGKATGSYEDLVWGWATSDGRVWGRPVDVEYDRRLGLLISDDGGGVIWRVTRK
jgi:glucose/arabinose dehydrogenase